VPAINWSKEKMVEEAQRDWTNRLREIGILENVQVLALLLLYFSASGLTLPDLEGRRVQPIGTGTVALVFTRTDCPISNRYAPVVNRLYQRYSPKGVTFWLVYVDPKQSVEKVREHMQEYGYNFGALLDRKHELVRETKATVTPEAAVFRDGRLLYRGRIDDRYVAFGKSRQAATVHDLAEAIEAALGGKAPEATRETKAVGCFIEDLR
jgi:hypothetical protein